jgi:hypothetical protein
MKSDKRFPLTLFVGEPQEWWWALESMPMISSQLEVEASVRMSLRRLGRGSLMGQYRLTIAMVFLLRCQTAV